MGIEYTLSYALNVAFGISDDDNGKPPSLREAVRSIRSISNEIFRQAAEPDIEPLDERATPPVLSQAMQNLLQRQEHSTWFNFEMKQFGERFLEEILESPTLVAGILAWDKLIEKEEASNSPFKHRLAFLRDVSWICSNKVASFVGTRNLAVTLDDMPYQMPDNTGAYIKPYIPFYELDQHDGTGKISLNANNHVSVLADPYFAIREIFSAHILSIQQSLAAIKGGSAQRNGSILRDDIENLSLIFGEHAEVSPLLPEFRNKQFHVACINKQSSLFADKLRESIEQQGETILQNQSFIDRIKIRMSYGSIQP